MFKLGGDWKIIRSYYLTTVTYFNEVSMSWAIRVCVGPIGRFIADMSNVYRNACNNLRVNHNLITKFIPMKNFMKYCEIHFAAASDIFRTISKYFVQRDNLPFK